MSAAVPRSVLTMIPIALIDEPDIAMRQVMDPIAMDELVADIRARGVLQNLVLIQAGPRYRVAAGHRRRIAAKIAGLSEVPAQVWPEGTPEEEAIKVAENLMRERVNPADEALYYAKLLEERCSGDVEKLYGLVGQKPSYVEGRLALLGGYEEVFHALQDGKITISAAIELNKYKDHGFALVDLATCIETGSSARYIIRQRTERERLFAAYPAPEAAGAAPADYQPAAPKPQLCEVCGEGHDPWNLDVTYVHRGGPCRKIMDRALGRSGGGEA